MIREEEKIRDKLKFFTDEKVPMHITMKPFIGSLGKFYNGVVKEFRENCVIFEDEKIGETMLFYSEISYVERRIPK